MPKLSESCVYRGGITANSMSKETNNVNLERFKDEGELYISFDMASKGGGTTHVRVDIGESDYGKLLGAMFISSPQRMLQVCAAELAKNIMSVPELIDESYQQGIEAVKEAAAQKYNDAPLDNDTLEKIVLDGVEKIVTEIENSPATDD